MGFCFNDEKMHSEKTIAPPSTTPALDADTETGGTFLPPITGGGLFETMSGKENEETETDSFVATSPGKTLSPELTNAPLEKSCVTAESGPKIRAILNPIINRIISESEPDGSLADDLIEQQETPYNKREPNHFEKWRLNILEAMRGIEDMDAGSQYFDMGTPLYDQRIKLISQENDLHDKNIKSIKKNYKGQKKRNEKSGENERHRIKSDQLKFGLKEGSKDWNEQPVTSRPSLASLRGQLGGAKNKDSVNVNSKNPDPSRYLDADRIFQYSNEDSTTCNFKFLAPRTAENIVPIFTPHAIDNIIDQASMDLSDPTSIYSPLKDSSAFMQGSTGTMFEKFEFYSEQIKTNPDFAPRRQEAQSTWTQREQTKKEDALRAQYTQLMHLHPNEISWSNWFPFLHAESGLVQQYDQDRQPIPQKEPLYYDKYGNPLTQSQTESATELYDFVGKRLYRPDAPIYNTDGRLLPKAYRLFKEWVDNHKVSTHDALIAKHPDAYTAELEPYGWEADALKLDILVQESQDLLYDQKWSIAPPVVNANHQTKGPKDQQMRDEWFTAGTIKAGSENKDIMSGTELKLTHVSQPKDYKNESGMPRPGVYGEASEKRYSKYNEESSYQRDPSFGGNYSTFDEIITWHIAYSVTEDK
jgi:hypothetical protein